MEDPENWRVAVLDCSSEAEDSPRIPVVLLCLALLLPTACAPLKPHDTSRPLSQTMRMVPIDDLDDLFNEETAYVEVFSRTQRGRASTVFFANHRPNVCTSNPILLSRSPITGWKAWQFDGFPFQNHGWVYVGRSIDRNELFAVVDYIIEGPGSHLVVLRSFNEGSTWLLGGEIEKPYYWSHLHEVRIQSRGSGTVSVCLHDDYNSETKAGYYIYATKNGGDTWSAPEYSPRPETEITELSLCHRGPRISSRRELRSLVAR